MERLRRMDSHFTAAKEASVGKASNRLQWYRQQSNLDDKLLQRLWLIDDEHFELRKQFQQIFLNKKIFVDETREEDTRHEKRTKTNA
jgi:hypothetical protein